MPATEADVFGRLINRLAADFPHLDPSHVRDCVDRIVATFAGATVRTYLPILVDRRARAVLCASVPADGASLAGGDAGPAPSLSLA